MKILIFHGYLLRGTGIRIKSISYAGDDYTSRPFDASSGTDITDVVVTLTSKSIVLTGTARDARNQPSNEMAVIVRLAAATVSGVRARRAAPSAARCAAFASDIPPYPHRVPAATATLLRFTGQGSRR